MNLSVIRFKHFVAGFSDKLNFLTQKFTPKKSSEAVILAETANFVWSKHSSKKTSNN